MVGRGGRDRLLEICRPLADRFGAAGHQLYLVGGVVRDLEVGREAAAPDLDLTTDARPAEVKALLSGWADALWTQGERFGTIGASRGELRVEVTTHRAEAYDPASRKPRVVFADGVEADLSRRDFTVNAIAIRLPDGRVVDPFGGRDDLRSGVLRTPLDPEESFSDDPLRMLRAARFTAGYRLRPRPELIEAVRVLGDRLAIVSAERVRDELGKLLCLPDPTAGLAFLVESGLAARVLPEVVDAAPEMASAPPGLVTRLAAGLVAGSTSDAEASSRAEARALALRLAAADRRRLVALVRVGRALTALARSRRSPSDGDLRRLLVDAGPVLDEAVSVARAVSAAGSEGALEPVRRRLDDIRVTEGPVGFDAPLDGATVMALLGLDPGPVVGEAIRALRAARLEDGPLDDDQARAFLDRWWAARQASGG